MKKRLISLILVIAMLLSLTPSAVFADNEDQTVSHTVTFVLNGHGEAIKPKEVTDGDLVEKPDDPSEIGYTFMGWFTDEDLNNKYDFDTPVTAAFTLYAKWEVNTYTVTLETNGGEIAEGRNVTSYTYGVGATLPTVEDISRTGYTFAGWFENDKLEGSPVTEISITETGDKTFYAKWEVDTYTVTLETNGGEIAEGRNVTSYTYGEGAVLPTDGDISRFGYIFIGWFADPAFGGDPITAITSEDIGNKEYYAAWQARSYRVTLNPLTGDIKEGKNIVSYTYDTTVTLPTAEDMEVQGEYTFAGWFRDKGTFKLGPVTAITSDEITESTTALIYYAKWVTKTYQVTLVTNGGQINDGDVTEYIFGIGANLPTDVTRTGYTFAGWFDNEELTGSPVTRITSEDTGDKTFYAKWTVNSYKVTLVLNGGTLAEGREVTSYTYGEETPLPTASDMTLVGHTFAGWYQKADLSGEPLTAIAAGTLGDLTLYAGWTADTYPITLHYDPEATLSGEAPASYTYGVGVTLPTVSRYGYVFEGWFDNADYEGSPITAIGKTETGSREYYAKLTLGVYTVTLNTNGGTVNSGNITSYTFGEGAILPTDVTRTGYTFAGWFDNEKLTGSPVTGIGEDETGNKTFYAKWTANTYAVVLESNGGAIASGKDITSYTFGIGAVLPTAKDVTRTGYTFGGWYVNEDFSGSAVTEIGKDETGDKVFYAKWTNDDYSITYVTNGGQINDADYATGYKYGTGALLPTDVTRTGYTFTGWFADKSCTGAPITSISSTATGNKTFYAGWEANTYKVTFEVNGGSINSGNITEYTYGVGAALPTDVTNSGGYTFGGWYENADFSGSAVTSIKTTDLGDKIFYAKWNTTAIDAPQPLLGLIYTGSEQTGVRSGTGYSLTGHTAINAGSYTATASLREGYTWRDGSTTPMSITWSISAKMLSLASSDILLAYTSVTYDGSEKRPAVTEVRDGSMIVAASEYDVVYSGNIYAGTATVTVSDRTGGNYHISGQTTFTIEKRFLTVSGIAVLDKVYDGTTSAAVDLSGLTYKGKVEGDEIEIDVTAAFKDSEVGEDKVCDLTLILHGSKAANYQLSEESQSTALATIRRYILFGDANTDGSIDSDDAALILRYTVDIISSADIDMEACDVSADGRVNALDASMILRYLVGLLAAFPAKN